MLKKRRKDPPRLQLFSRIKACSVGNEGILLFEDFSMSNVDAMAGSSAACAWILDPLTL